MWHKWCDHRHESVCQSLWGRALEFGEFVVELGDAGNGGIEAQGVHVGVDGFDRAVQHLVEVVGHRNVGDSEFAGLFVDEVPPDALQKAHRANDRLRFPWTILVDRPHEHLVQPERVCAVVAVHVIWRDRVLQALAHLAVLASDRLPLVRVVAIRFFDIGGFDVDAAVVLEGKGLDITLVDQALERLGRADVTQVEQHLVPEAAVEQVEHSVLDAADIEVDTTVVRVIAAHPVFLRHWIGHCVGADRVDVAHVVPTRASPLGHRVEVTFVGLESVAKVDFDGGPSIGAAERRLWFGVLVEFARRPVDQLRKVDRQHVVWE